MSGIYRVRKNADYFTASNKPFNDKRLTWEARGIMGYLLSKPDGWECRNYDLVNNGPAGEHIIKRIMKELRQYGYIHRYRVSDGKGQIDWVTDVYENPDDNPSLRRGDFPPVEKPSVENSTVENSHDIVSTNPVSTKSINTDIYTPPQKTNSKPTKKSHIPLIPVCDNGEDLETEAAKVRPFVDEFENNWYELLGAEWKKVSSLARKPGASLERWQSSIMEMTASKVRTVDRAIEIYNAGGTWAALCAKWNKENEAKQQTTGPAVPQLTPEQLKRIAEIEGATA